MTFRLAALALSALLLMTGPGLSQSTEPASDMPAAVDAPAAPAPKRVSTGACVILKGEQIVDQQNCKALAAAEDTAVNGSAAAGFANGITYVWPSGNRTIVGGADDDFSVNGNAAVPLPDAGHGLCLRVEKTGNTFCYKEGAKVKAVAAVQAGVPAPVAIKRVPAGTAVAGATIAAPAASAAVPANSLAEEIRLRKAAQEEVESLKAEIARLYDAEEMRRAELAEQRRTAEAERQKKSTEGEAEKARVASALKEIDDLKARCSSRDATACERALVLAREASLTGSVESATVSELQQLQTLAMAPFGVQALSFLAGVPRSTWAASSIAAFLALALLLVIARGRGGDVSHDDVGALPSLDEPQIPSLDPFTPTASGFPPATANMSPGLSPPPIPAFASMPSLFPAKEA